MAHVHSFSLPGSINNNLEEAPWTASRSESLGTCFTISNMHVKMASIIIYFILIIASKATSSCELTAKWTEIYKQAAYSALNVTPYDLELKKCVDRHPIVDTDNVEYQIADGSSSEPCCHMISLEDCLYDAMIQFNLSERSAKAHSRSFTLLWSSNNYDKCDNLLTRHCATCLIYLNKAVIISIATITSCAVLGIPLTILVIKYGWRWYCFGQRPQVPSAVQSLINNMSET